METIELSFSEICKIIYNYTTITVITRYLFINKMESLYSLAFVLSSLFIFNLEAGPVMKKSVNNAHIDSIHLRLGVLNEVVLNMVSKISSVMGDIDQSFMEFIVQ